MSFDEIRFPDDVSRGARGGPRRRTQVVTLASGAEERNASWADSRRVYDVSYGVRTADDLAAVVAFFEARNGRLRGFRFKDWLDWKSSIPSAAISAVDERIGVGDGAQVIFQLEKRYVSGSRTWIRRITKPVAGTVLVAIDGAPQPSGWTLDPTVGGVTFDAPPPDGATITAGFEFDVPVRFDTDALDTVLSIERLGTIPSIPLIEIRP